ncbi:hypothetical protein [Arthrobacter sp. Leaf137]|uniref:hypothetical protein n=1 Tax=Arthrobacter sp. Leaf137 TaxID=1736271 RepID=UPI002570DCAE|nr:hypothetical protein [Arthrobacter sp. Leaf137]
MVSTLTGASALSVLGAKSAQAATGDKGTPNSYVPIAEKGAPSGVATLDESAKILSTQVPDLSASYAPRASTTGGVKVVGDQGLNSYQYRGANPVAGPPTTGTYDFGDLVRDSNAQNWVCVTSGTPGVWNPANPGFTGQVPTTFGDRYAQVSNAGNPVLCSGTPFTLPVTNTRNFPTAGKVIIGTAKPRGNGAPVHLSVSYTGVTASSFTGCTITGADTYVPDAEDIWYGKSDLRGGALTVANQIIATSGSDSRPHDLVLVAAYDTSPDHALGDYDIVLTRQAGSYGVVQLDMPVRTNLDVSFGDSSNNRLMTISGGNARSGDQGIPTIPNQSIAFAATLVGDQGVNQNFVYKNRSTSSQYIFQRSDGSKLFYFQDAGPTIANTALINFASSNGSGFAYLTMTAGNTLSCTIGAGGARWMNNAFTRQILTLSNSGSLILGPTLALNAIDGFPYIPAGLGSPTGTPTPQAGHVPLFYDTANHKLWVFDGTWRGTVLT